MKDDLGGLGRVWRVCRARVVQTIASTLVLAITAWATCNAAEDAQWILIRSSHFDVYSQAGEQEGRSTAAALERLYQFFESTTLTGNHAPVRVIEFRTPKDYAAFQPQPVADAYSVTGSNVEYIVMPRLGPDQFRTVAHEYAHVLLHSLGQRLPPWFDEGLSEVLSTVHISASETSIGGDLPPRTMVLLNRPWIPLTQILNVREDARLRIDRKAAEMFYAESWALTHMLVFSPQYAPRFRQVWNALMAGTLDGPALTRIYEKSLPDLEKDLRAWAEKEKIGLPFAGIPGISQAVRVSRLSTVEAQTILADLMLANGDFDRATAAYVRISSEKPNDAAPAAALGMIALRKGDKVKARQEWKRATELGAADPMLCYRYAVLAQDAGLPAAEITSALRRAVTLQPDFDDARYMLGLLENSGGHPAAALEQLRAMRTVAPGRAYGYWIAIASASIETDQREQAKQAAEQARKAANTDQERTAASQLAYMADTDLTVQFARDSAGNLHMVTARKPHGAGNWNPFIETSDRIHTLTGQIRKVKCVAGKITGFQIESVTGTVEIALPDPTRVLIEGGKAEFVCDAEDGRKVAIQYAESETPAASTGILRGMQFQPSDGTLIDR